MEVDIIVDKTQNALLRQLIVQLHKDATITPTTEVYDKCIIPLPNEEDDSVGGLYNEEAYMKFQ